MLSIGYQYYLDSLCGKCGTPAWYGRSESSEISFEVEHTICYACAELDRERNQPNFKQEPGETSYAVPKGIEYADGTTEPLPDPMVALSQVK